MTRAKWSAEKERVFKAAMRWYRAWKGGWDRPSFIFPTKLDNACAAAAKAKRGKRKPAKWKPDTPSPYDLSEPVRRKRK